MAKLKPRVKRVSLEFVGEGWQGAHIDFAALKWSDVKGMEPAEGDESHPFELALEVLQRKFLAGQGIDEAGNPVPMVAEDLADLDIETLGEISQQLGGAPSPNA